MKRLFCVNTFAIIKFYIAINAPYIALSAAIISLLMGINSLKLLFSANKTRLLIGFCEDCFVFLPKL
ncbi:MAG: hypothetical protein IKY82_06690 [Alistipes sp.]|nr:hypothetical protein [Alistipes sp.]